MKRQRDGQEVPPLSDAEFIEKIMQTIEMRSFYYERRELCKVDKAEGYYLGIKESIKELYTLADEGKYLEILTNDDQEGYTDITEPYSSENLAAVAYAHFKCKGKDEKFSVKEAIKYLDAALEFSPNCASALMVMQKFSSEIENYLCQNEQAKYFSSLSTLPDLQYYRGDFKNALENYNQANLWPSHAASFINRADIKYRFNDLSGALEDASQFINWLEECRAEDNVSEEEQYSDYDDYGYYLVRCYILRANIEIKLGDYMAAKNSLKKADQYNESQFYYFIQAAVTEAKLAFKLGLYDETQNFINSVLVVEPKNTDALQLQGALQLQYAINNFAQALKILPFDCALKEKLVHLYQAAEQPREIIKLDLDECQRKAKTEPLPLKNLVRHTILFKHDEVHQVYKKNEEYFPPSLIDEILKNSAITKEHITAAREMNGISTDSDTIIDTLSKQLK